MLHCHPRQAWALMMEGKSLKQVAAMSNDDPGELDRAIWDWRADVSGAVTPEALDDIKRWCAEEASYADVEARA